MYVLEYLIYHVKPYGINHNILGTPSKTSYYMNFNPVSQTEKISVTEVEVTNKDIKEVKSTSHNSDNLIKNTVR